MKILIAVAVVSLLSAGQTRAQSFEQSLEQGRVLSLQARKTLAERPHVVAFSQAPVFAKVIVWFFAPKTKKEKDLGLPGHLRFYTRLDRLRSLNALPEGGIGLLVWDGVAPKADESAAQLAESSEARVWRKSFQYASSNCDMDYTFSFGTESLLRRSPQEANRPVTGHMLIETRGQTDWDGDLPCVAYFR